MTNLQPLEEEDRCRKKSTEEFQNELFNSLDWEGEGLVSSHIFLETLRENGILDSDPRMKSVVSKLKEIGGYKRDIKLTVDDFSNIYSGNATIIKKALKGKLVVPDFREFTQELKAIYDECLGISGGTNAQYIPELAKQDPNWFALSVCTVDGQQWSVGDSNHPFCVQSCSKPISYLMAAEEHGFAKVHHHVGTEPSGTSFNDLTLKEVDNTEAGETRKIPHNPMINAGAIMTCSLVKKGKPMSERFGHTIRTFQALAGGSRIGFDNPTYLSERDSADRNWCLGYMMQEFHSFPENTDLRETLEFYFQTCSLLLDCEQSAQIAATLANGGVNPTTGIRIFSADHVRNCLSLMLSSGMYDFSGEWAFTVGLPAKSGVAGLIYIVIPNKMGVAVWSPPLDGNGNSWRGVELVKKLVSRFNFHHFDKLSGVHSKMKIDPTLKKNEAVQNDTIALLFAASEGDIKEMARLHANGIDIFAADYDARTAIHLAASEGHYDVVKYIINEAQKLPKAEQMEFISPIDRWNRSPLDDAYSASHRKVIELLIKVGCKKSVMDDSDDIVFKNEIVRTKSFRNQQSSPHGMSPKKTHF